MKIKERRELRINLLRELYNIYFDTVNNSNSKTISDNLAQEDKEKYLAYDYLINKNLIKDTKMGGITPKYSITVDGIDLIESMEFY